MRENDSSSPTSRCVWITLLWHALSVLAHALQVVVQVAGAFAQVVQEIRLHLVVSLPQPTQRAPTTNRTRSRRAPIVSRTWPPRQPPVRTAPAIPTAPPRVRTWAFSNASNPPAGRAAIFRTVTQHVPAAASPSPDAPPPYVRNSATHRHSNNDR